MSTFFSYICLSILHQDSMKFMMPFAMSKHFYLLPNCQLIFHCFINHSLANIMSFCKTWILMPRMMVLCGQCNFSSMQSLSTIWNKNYWSIKSKWPKARPLEHKNTHWGTWLTSEVRDELIIGWECLYNGVSKLLGRKFTTQMPSWLCLSLVERVS